MKEIITREEAMKKHITNQWWFLGTLFFFLILSLMALKVSNIFGSIILFIGIIIAFISFHFDVIAMQNKMIISELRMLRRDLNDRNNRTNRR